MNHLLLSLVYMSAMSQVATMLGACLTKEEVDEFMSEADVVSR